MVVGLTRHFLVPHRRAEWLSAEGFARWANWYDGAVGELPSPCPVAEPFSACISSDLKRASSTASAIYRGDVRKTAALREVPFAPVLRFGYMPLFLWQGLARLAWYFGHGSQPESRQETRQRIGAFVDSLLHSGQESVLVVAHGFMMQLLSRELRARGFRGRVALRPRGGRVYRFESPRAARASAPRA